MEKTIAPEGRLTAATASCSFGAVTQPSANAPISGTLRPDVERLREFTECTRVETMRRIQRFQRMVVEMRKRGQSRAAFFFGFTERAGL